MRCALSGKKKTAKKNIAQEPKANTMQSGIKSDQPNKKWSMLFENTTAGVATNTINGRIKAAKNVGKILFLSGVFSIEFFIINTFTTTF